jgi:predicted RNA-binding protein YlqC (UPF0109 family)
VTDLYEAGDINPSGGGGDSGDSEFDDAVDDDFEDEYDDEDEGTDGGAEAEEGNRRSAVDGGTPLAVLTYLARSLSNDPDSVVIETEERRGGLRLNLHVAPDDMGRVIGRRGRTAQAIRTLVNVAGAKDGAQASVDIVDD